MLMQLRLYLKATLTSLSVIDTHYIQYRDNWLAYHNWVYDQSLICFGWSLYKSMEAKGKSHYLHHTSFKNLFCQLFLRHAFEFFPILLRMCSSHAGFLKANQRPWCRFELLITVMIHGSGKGVVRVRIQTFVWKLGYVSKQHQLEIIATASPRGLPQMLQLPARDWGLYTFNSLSTN